MRKTRVFLLSFFAVLFLLPFYLLIKNALSTQDEITAIHWKVLPDQLHWENFSAVWHDDSVPFVHSLLNSLLVSLTQTVGVIFISALAGYAFARYQSRTATILWKCVLGTLLLPATITFVPSFLLLSQLRWLDSLHGLIVPGLFQAFATIMFRQFVEQFPIDIEHAARLDGLKPLRILWSIVLPNAIPTIAALTVLTFVESWNSFMWPFIVASDPHSWTIQLSLSTFLGTQAANLTELFAGTTIAIIPAGIVFLSLSRYMVRTPHGLGL